MKVSASVKPAVWGAVGGAIVAMVIGFVWGGWVTGKTAGEMVAESAKVATVQALAPLCVARAELQPAQLVLLKKTNDWERDEFVVESGWVANVSEQYRSAVAESCASTAVEGMDAKPTS